MRREVKSNPEVLSNAINDGINEFVREVLAKRGLIDERRYFGPDESKELSELRHEIARRMAEKWRVCWISDDA